MTYLRACLSVVLWCVELQRSALKTALFHHIWGRFEGVIHLNEARRCMLRVNFTLRIKYDPHWSVKCSGETWFRLPFYMNKGYKNYAHSQAACITKYSACCPTYKSKYVENKCKQAVYMDLIHAHVPNQDMIPDTQFSKLVRRNYFWDESQNYLHIKNKHKITILEQSYQIKK